MNGNKLKILVVDDDNDDLFLTCSFLEAVDTYQMEIDTEINYKKASEKIAENRHDIYIIDYLLGPHTGVELIVESVKRGVNKPYILLTGKGDKQIDIEATKAGAYDYLIKSEINTELLERSLRYSIQRYMAYMAVVKSEQKFRNIFNKTTDIIFLLNSEMEFVNFNLAMPRILGYESAALNNRPFLSLFANEPSGRILLEDLRHLGEISNAEIVLKTRDGDTRTFLASCTKIVTEDQNIEYQGILFDYTTIKKSLADELLREKTEATNQLVRTLAHEIRNPLTNIDLAVSHLETELTDDQQFFAEIIKRNSKRVNDLIKELVSISKPQENKLEKVEVTRLLQETILRAADRIELKKIKVLRELPTEEIYITADSAKMQIALLNIIINAVEAVESGAGVLELCVRTRNDRVEIIIADNGPGIDEQHRARLFQPYFTGKKNGMGLGLANTHSVISSHKGEIEVESSPGKGSRFSILLPRVAVAV